MEKAFYETPVLTVFELKTEGALLTGSAEAMHTVNGSWDNEEEW